MNSENHNQPSPVEIPPGIGVMTITILHLTTVHVRFDIRVFHKEAQTLACCLRYRVIIMVADGKGSLDKGRGHVSIHDLGRPTGGRLSRVLLGSWRALLAIRKLKPDLIHFHDPELIPLMLLLKAMGYRVIYDVHEDTPRMVTSRTWLPCIVRKPVAWTMSGMEWLGSKAFDALVSVTPKIADRFPRSKTTVIQNYPLIAEMLSQASIPYTERAPAFAYVGIISRIRSAVEMVRAFELLDETFCAKLEMAGEFDPSSLEEALRNLPGWTAVHFHGDVSRSEVAQILNRARAGLVLFYPLPNHIDSQPNKLFEYMSAGIPVIASDFPLWRQIVSSARCGLLVDPQDPRAIAEAMRWILKHPAEAETMGQRGRLAVEHTYNWDIEVTKLIDLYSKLLPC